MDRGEPKKARTENAAGRATESKRLAAHVPGSRAGLPNVLDSNVSDATDHAFFSLDSIVPKSDRTREFLVTVMQLAFLRSGAIRGVATLEHNAGTGLYHLRGAAICSRRHFPRLIRQRACKAVEAVRDHYVEPGQGIQFSVLFHRSTNDFPAAMWSFNDKVKYLTYAAGDRTIDNRPLFFNCEADSIWASAQDEKRLDGHAPGSRASIPKMLDSNVWNWADHAFFSVDCVAPHSQCAPGMLVSVMQSAFGQSGAVRGVAVLKLVRDTGLHQLSGTAICSRYHAPTLIRRRACRAVDTARQDYMELGQALHISVLFRRSIGCSCSAKWSFNDMVKVVIEAVGDKIIDNKISFFNCTADTIWHVAEDGARDAELEMEGSLLDARAGAACLISGAPELGSVSDQLSTAMSPTESQRANAEAREAHS